MPKITVYYFTGYHIATDQIIRSKRMATLETIKDSIVRHSWKPPKK
jgi:hypothetical protein